MTALGVVALVAAVIVLASAWSRARTAQVMTVREPTSCAEIPSLTGRVLVEGEVVAGARGPLAAPVSGERCVWYRIGSRPATDRWFVLRDISGSIEVDPAALRPHRFAESPDSPDLGRGDVERALPVGTTVSVSGEVIHGADGSVHLGGSPLVVSTLTVAELRLAETRPLRYGVAFSLVAIFTAVIALARGFR